MFTENFSKNSNLDDSGISLPVFPSQTNLKLHNISVAPKMVKKVIMNLDLSKACGPDCFPVVGLRNCEPELSYILAELFRVWTELNKVWQADLVQKRMSYGISSQIFYLISSFLSNRWLWVVLNGKS